MAKAKSKSRKATMTVTERNWLIVVLLLFAALVLFVFYSLAQTNYGSNGVFQTPQAHTTSPAK